MPTEPQVWLKKHDIELLDGTNNEKVPDIWQTIDPLSLNYQISLFIKIHYRLPDGT